MGLSILNYVIIGFSEFARERIVKEGFAMDADRFDPLPGVRLVGATSRSARRRGEVERYGLKWYDSVEAVCEDDRIHAAFIVTNNSTHFPIAEKLIRAKKHVIVEKPITSTLEDARRLLDLAAEHDVSLAVDHMMVFNAYNIKARDLVRRGVLGDVNDIVLHMEFPYGFTAEEARSWRCADPSEIGGPIGDVASHCFYMAEFLLDDRITTIRATYTPVVNDLNVENGAFIRFRTERGTSGSIRVSFSDRRGSEYGAFENLGYEIYGDEKPLRAYGTLFQLSGHEDEPVKLRLEIDDYRDVESVAVTDVKNIYRQVVLQHAESIRTGERLTGEDAYHNLQLVLAAYRSADANGKAF